MLDVRKALLSCFAQLYAHPQPYSASIIIMPKGKGKEKLATDGELFAVDVVGDEKLRRQLHSSTWDAPAAAHPRRGSGKPLKAAQILAERSRVPARMSKAQPGVMVREMKERERRMKVTPELKRRLRSMVKHNNSNGEDRGLWDVQPAADRSGAALSEAVAQSGSYDVWQPAVATSSSTRLHDDIQDLVQKKPVKVSI